MRDYLDGVSGDYNRGEQAFITALEGVMFTPWYFYGFRFAPLAVTEYGVVSESRLKEAFTSHYFSNGAGIRISNPGLIFNTLETIVKYFPVNGPESGDIYFSISLSTPLFIRRNISAKPRVLAYSTNRLY